LLAELARDRRAFAVSRCSVAGVLSSSELEIELVPFLRGIAGPGRLAHAGWRSLPVNRLISPASNPNPVVKNCWNMVKTLLISQ
jgi:hypothetical protein